MTDKKERIIESLDKDGNEVKVLIKMPTATQYRDSQIEYNKAFRKALDSGALLRQKLEDYMVDQGIWNDQKQKQNDKYVEEINAMEERLKGGGIRLSEAKEIALNLRAKRAEFRGFLAERNALDQNSAEGQADNARFSELTRLCMLNPSNKLPFFGSQADYDSSADQPWVVEAAGELANMIYGLDPNYDNRLEENKFLKEFNFVDEDLRLVNEEGHLTDSEGRLINEDGRFIAYRTEEGKKNKNPDDVYFVNREGEEVVNVLDEEGNTTDEWVKVGLKERQPFLDDDDKPILSDSAPKKEETKATSKPKRKRKSTTSEKDAETT
tara:strand:+ start:498 stop:1469 length:972 start_codon:yes stop_codon:yes gene_type:complete